MPTKQPQHKSRLDWIQRGLGKLLGNTASGPTENSKHVVEKLRSVGDEKGQALYGRLQETGISLHEEGLELKQDPDTQVVYLLEYKEKGFGNYYEMSGLSPEDATYALQTPESLKIYHQTRRWKTQDNFPAK